MGWDLARWALVAAGRWASKSRLKFSVITKNSKSPTCPRESVSRRTDKSRRTGQSRWSR